MKILLSILVIALLIFGVFIFMHGYMTLQDIDREFNDNIKNKKDIL
jgi:hypothetical protein